MFKTVAKGGWNELSVGAELVRLGCPVSFPYGGGCRYDLIVDIKGRLLRVQCKTSTKKRDGVYEISLESSHQSGKKNVTLKYTSDEIDMYATVIEGKVCLIPIKACRTNAVATIYLEHRDGKLSVEDFTAEKVAGSENVLGVGECKVVRRKNRIKAKAWSRSVSKTRVMPNIPSAEELKQMIDKFPIWKVAKMNHIAQRTVWKLVEQYGLNVKRGIDSERIRNRGSYESASIKLTEYYSTHISPAAKKVIQYSLDGNEVARYDSIRIAARSTGFKIGQIKRVCLRLRPRYRGFVWRHEDDSFQ